MGRGRSFLATVVVGAAAMGCGGGGSGPDVVRVEPRGAVPTQGSIGVMDSTFVGFRTHSDEPSNVVVSHDDGHTWSVAELPGRPASLELESLYADGHGATVAGRDAESASDVLPVAKAQFIVWTTTDGDEWVSRVLDTAGGLAGAPTVTAVGRLLLASVSSTGGFNLFTSVDRGSSWHRAEISGFDHLPGEGLAPEVASTEGGQLRMVLKPSLGGLDRRQILTSGDDGSTWSAAPCGLDCPDPIEPGDVIVRLGEISTDRGSTWHRAQVDPPPPGEPPTSMLTVTKVPGGWLGSASSDDSSDISYGLLLRSADGRSWRQMLPPDPCVDPEIGRPYSRVGEPTRFDGRWYVTYDCSDLSGPRFGVIYAGGRDARKFEPIAATQRHGVTFGDPVHDTDRLLIPELGEDGLVAITIIG